MARAAGQRADDCVLLTQCRHQRVMQTIPVGGDGPAASASKIYCPWDRGRKSGLLTSASRTIFAKWSYGVKGSTISQSALRAALKLDGRSVRRSSQMYWVSLRPRSRAHGGRSSRYSRAIGSPTSKTSFRFREEGRQSLSECNAPLRIILGLGAR